MEKINKKFRKNKEKVEFEVWESENTQDFFKF